MNFPNNGLKYLVPLPPLSDLFHVYVVTLQNSDLQLYFFHRQDVRIAQEPRWIV